MDRAVGQKFTLTNRVAGTSLTFKVEKDFREGWFAYLSCAQPKRQFRVDMFRLYEGRLVPTRKSPSRRLAAVRLFTLFALPLFHPERGGEWPGWTEVAEDNGASVQGGRRSS